MQTDFPLPVTPEINKCGIRAKSAIITSPFSSLPIASGSFIELFCH
jgi:hypothetical protein